MRSNGEHFGRPLLRQPRPAGERLPNRQPYFRVSKNIAELEEKLTERLQGKDKNLFLDFCNAYGELMGESGLDSFLVGFRLGAKMIFDTFCSDDAPFESYLKE